MILHDKQLFQDLVHYINPIDNMANFNGVDEIYWHRKRYTPEEIKKIQVALNKQAPLAQQITVDGKFGKDTLAALYAFQNQHRLVADGLAGDKTLAQLGVDLGAGYALPATRKGMNQSRRAVNPNDQAMIKWANSPEVVKYLLNENAAIVDPERYKEYYEKALPYLDPETRSRVRYTNSTGDEYDEEVSQNHTAYGKQQQGLSNFKSAIQSGAIRSGKYFQQDLEDYMNRYDLTTFEMQELLADPMVHQAMQQGLAQHEYGQQHTQKAKAKEVEDSVRQTMDQAGRFIIGTAMNPMMPIYTGATYKPSDGSMFDYMTTNQKQFSDYLKERGVIGQHDGFGGKVLDMGLDIIGNPWSWGNLGASAYKGARNIMANAKNGLYGIRPQGIEQIAERSVINPVTNERVVINQTRTVSPMTKWPDGSFVRTVDGRFGNAGATGVSHKGLSANGNGLLLDDAMRNQTGQFMEGMSPRIRGGYTQGSYHGGRTVSKPYFDTYSSVYSPSIGTAISVGNAVTNAVAPSLMVRETPSRYQFEKPNFQLDYSRTYGPWNTLQYMDQDADKMFSGLVTRKHGGKMQYPQYKHGGKIITKYI